MTRKMIDAGYQPYKFDAKFDIPFEELINKSTEDLKSFMSGLSEVIMPSMSSTDPLNFETLVWDSLALDMTREYEYLFKALQQTRKIFKYIHRLNMSSPISTRASATILRFASTSNDSFLLNKSLNKIENAL